MTDVGDWIDIGHDHWLKFTSWAPDRSIPANVERFGDVPDVKRYGCIIKHNKPDGSECWGSIRFDTPEVNAIPGNPGPGWSVESWDPLTISPSLQCACGDHGFIRGGRWVPA